MRDNIIMQCPDCKNRNYSTTKNKRANAEAGRARAVSMSPPVEDRELPAGEYAVGWIKRGPSGVIGTNKSDAVETVTSLLADVHDGAVKAHGRSGMLDRLLALTTLLEDDSFDVERGAADEMAQALEPIATTRPCPLRSRCGRQSRTPFSVSTSGRSIRAGLPIIASSTDSA